MCPVDTIKTRLQFQGTLSALTVTRYNNVFDAFWNIIKNEGPIAFTRGLGARLLYMIPAASVSFLCYEQIVKAFKTQETKEDIVMPSLLPFIGLTCGRFLGTAVRTPFDVIKQRLQVDGSLKKKKYKNTIQAFRLVWKTEGLSGLFGTAHVAILRDAPFSCVYFTSYELAKVTQSKMMNGAENLGTLNHLISGAFAGMTSSVLTIPMDVVKTQLQTQAALPPGERHYKGIIDAFRHIYRNEGFRGLTRGLTARVLYITPSAAIVWTSYETYKRLYSTYLAPHLHTK